MKFQYNDGGRAAAGYKGATRDCVARSMAIATQMGYEYCYDMVQTNCKDHGDGGARNGVPKKVTRAMMEVLGWEWVPTMGIGTGCKVHLRDGELPMGRLMVSTSRHITAVIDGVIYDTYDPSRGGTRCVYGYWRQA